MEQEVKNEIKSIFDETVKGYADKVEELETKVKTLESKPLSVPTIITRETYKGRNVNDQLVVLREKAIKAGKNPDMYNGLAKALIDMAEAGQQGIPLSFTKAAAEHVEGTTTAGGFLLLDEYDRELVKTARENSVMMALCNNKTIGSTDTFKFNKADADVTVSWDAEGNVTKKSATFAQGSIAIKRLSGYVAVSNELLADSAYDIAGEITEQFAYAMGQEVDNQILNGTGSPCSGILGATAGYSVTFGTAGSSNWSSVTADVFSEAIAKLATNDLANATFVLGKQGAHFVRTLKDLQNNPIFQAIAGPNLNTIYGNPMVVANKIDDSVGGTGGYYAVLGDFRKWYIINRLSQLELLVDPYSDSVNYNTRFIFAKRLGLGVQRNTAFVRIGTN